MDRFGDIPRSVDNLLAIAALKALAHRAYVTEVKINRQEIRMTMYQKARLIRWDTGAGRGMQRRFKIPDDRAALFSVYRPETKK